MLTLIAELYQASVCIYFITQQTANYSSLHFYQQQLLTVTKNRVTYQLLVITLISWL